MPSSNPHDFLNMYVRLRGESEVPSVFHVMAGLSILAASVADRVWFARDTSGTRIYPNLYVFLIGPSGSGKERAITSAAKLLSEVPDTGVFPSTGITKQFIIDELDKKAKQGTPPYLYLITEELGMSVHSKEVGRDLIKFMTGNYIPSGMAMNEGTRMHGAKTVPPNTTLNWLAGTTDDWLVEAVEKSAVMGGFFARVLSVRGKRTGDIRYAEMIYPPDYHTLRDKVRVRLETYSKLQARFVKTPEASAYYTDWYESHDKRPSPTDPLMEAAFNRTDEMVHRLALLLKLSSMEDIPGYATDIPVDVSHFHEAIQMWYAIIQDVPETIKRAAATRESEDVDTVAALVQRHKKIDHSTLLRRASNHGMNADRVARSLRDLEGRNEVKLDVEPTSHGKTKRIYLWIG